MFRNYSLIYVVYLLVSSPILPVFNYHHYGYFSSPACLGLFRHLFLAIRRPIDPFHNLCTHAHNCFRLAKMIGVL